MKNIHLNSHPVTVKDMCLECNPLHQHRYYSILLLGCAICLDIRHLRGIESPTPDVFLKLDLDSISASNLILDLLNEFIMFPFAIMISTIFYGRRQAASSRQML
jgi:hypothetical protein